MKKEKQLDPQITEPTPAEINKAAEKVMKKYDVVLNDSDAAEMAKLFKELEFWFSIERFSRDPKSISIDAAEEVRAYIKKARGKDFTLDEAHQYADSALKKIFTAKREEISNSIKDILSRYQPL